MTPHLADFDVQDIHGPYFRAVCRYCRMTWYLPKDERRRTKDALAVLREHARRHGPCMKENARLGAGQG